jgi:hypothetical protein
MQTNVRTPTEIFNQPQRLLVPLFQRPYVWDEQRQWEPLWSDVVRVATRLLDGGRDTPQPHFLGAVVIQQIQNAMGDLQTRIVIDGQQRLTTLQIVLDAVHAVFEQRGHVHAAARLAYLVENAEAFRRKPEDRFKVWPTNHDREAFNEVMGIKPPINYDALRHAGSRLVKAHRYFLTQAEEWLNEESHHTEPQRADALETAISKLMQLVVIDLQVDENAQEIFETLNARGTPLTPVDLIKNFVFQRLSEEGADVEKIYTDYWELYESEFWEEEILSGRLRRPRAVVFFNHWLFSMLGEDVTSSEVFSIFKRYLIDRPELSTIELVKRIHRAATVYEDITRKGQAGQGEVDRIALFAYRAEAMQSDVVKPLLLALLDPDRESPIPADAIEQILDDVESWLVRRMLTRVTTKNYNRTIVDLITILRSAPVDDVHHQIRAFLARQLGDSVYWPDDAMVRQSLSRMPIYRRISRSRMRMVLEAIEDYLRGYGTGKQGFTGVRTPRGLYTIEHLMPQSWEANWPPPDDGDEALRGERLHMLGNLTLVTQALNSKVSNGAWDVKSAELNRHGVVLLNNRLADFTQGAWTDAAIEQRTSVLIDMILRIWKVPEGHVLPSTDVVALVPAKVGVADLLRAGLLTPGAVLETTWPSLRGVHVTVRDDGALMLGDVAYYSPSSAGSAVRDGKATNGWSFWKLAGTGGQTLDDLRGRLVGEDLTSDDIDESDDEETSGETDAASTRDMQHRFWLGFVRHNIDAETGLALGVARPRSVMTISINKAKVNITAVCLSWSSYEDDSAQLRVELRVFENHPSYERLLSQREAIESEYGAPLNWYKVPDVKRAKIYESFATDIFDESRWPEYYDWLTERIIRMRDVMGKRL